MTNPEPSQRDPSPHAADWGLDPDVDFLNHGSFGACPLAVLDEQQELRRCMEREPVRFFTREVPPQLDASREALAALVGADPADMVFVRNATSGVNAVLRSLPFGPGDELLLTDHGYNACRCAAELVEDGPPALMAQNHRLAVRAGRMLRERLGLSLLCPETMLGAMAAVRLPDEAGPVEMDTATSPTPSHPLHTALLDRFGIEVPVYHWPAPPRRLVRISAQAYNSPAQYERLAAALRELL